MPLKFHQKTFDLLEQAPPQVSPQMLEILRERERLCGVKFPESVIEWYSLEGSYELLQKHSRADDLHHPKNFGQEYDDWYDGGPRDFIKEGLLMILHENQGVCNLAVRLDGSQDPPVMIEVDTAPNDVWIKYVDHFSDFVYTQIWDNNYYDNLFTSNGESPLSKTDLDYLQKHFQEGIRTFGWPGAENYRFYSKDAKILIWNSLHPEWVDWSVTGRTRTATVHLLRQLFNCGNLRNTLSGYNDENADLLLEAKQ